MKKKKIIQKLADGMLKMARKIHGGAANRAVKSEHKTH
jgi:hypothetical protein